MGFEYSTDLQIQSYLVCKIRLGAHGRSNIETSLLKDELKNYHTCYVSSINQSIKVYHHLINHSYSQNRITIQQTVTTLQQIVITFPQTVITLSEDIRFVRKLVNKGSKRYQRFVYRSTF
jgi:hypothetical protein